MFRTKQKFTASTKRAISLGSPFPFVGQNIPLVGHTLPEKRPSVGKSAPFVRDQGFTLIELMITLSILAIVGSFAMPAFRDMILNMRIQSDHSAMLGTFQIARSESTKRRLPVAVCGKTAGVITCNAAPDWNNGWLLWVDSNADGILDPAEEILRQNDGLESSIVITTSAAIGRLTYLPDGSSDAPINMEFRFCDNNRTGERGRSIQIGLTGRTKTDIYTGCA